ncbi:hypothetical protein DERF_011244 [Dermatophagoides farinae]|uniref:Uncharacterized protein n=1 Tax=Dermatophagoides farinae TaxID=6954 RepID=A0A922HUJ6_DERFA|nr:hypothetical protein DERF_011244 [Dermatophagoides farinae]
MNQSIKQSKKKMKIDDGDNINTEFINHFFDGTKNLFNITNYTMAELPQHTLLSLIEKDDRKDSKYIFDGDIKTIVKETMRQLVGYNKPYKVYIPQQVFRRIIHYIVEKYPSLMTRYERIIKKESEDGDDDDDIINRNQPTIFDYIMIKYRNQKNICTQRRKRQNKITTTIEEVVDDLDVDLLMDNNQSSTQPSTSSSS